MKEMHNSVLTGQSEGVRLSIVAPPPPHKKLIIRILAYIIIVRLKTISQKLQYIETSGN